MSDISITLNPIKFLKSQIQAVKTRVKTTQMAPQNISGSACFRLVTFITVTTANLDKMNISVAFRHFN